MYAQIVQKRGISSPSSSSEFNKISCHISEFLEWQNVLASINKLEKKKKHLAPAQQTDFFIKSNKKKK